MAKDPKFILNYLQQVETLASEVLSDKRDTIEAHKKRDKTREASRAIKRSNESDESGGGETWMCNGNMFMCFTKKQAAFLVEKDLNKYDKEINELHKTLKQKVSKLYDAEQKQTDKLKRFDLIPISKEEKQSLFDLVGK